MNHHTRKLRDVDFSILQSANRNPQLAIGLPGGETGRFVGRQSYLLLKLYQQRDILHKLDKALVLSNGIEIRLLVDRLNISESIANGQLQIFDG